MKYFLKVDLARAEGISQIHVHFSTRLMYLHLFILTFLFFSHTELLIFFSTISSRDTGACNVRWLWRSLITLERIIYFLFSFHERHSRLTRRDSLALSVWLKKLFLPMPTMLTFHSNSSFFSREFSKNSLFFVEIKKVSK